MLAINCLASDSTGLTQVDEVKLNAVFILTSSQFIFLSVLILLSNFQPYYFSVKLGVALYTAPLSLHNSTTPTLITGPRISGSGFPNAQYVEA